MTYSPDHVADGQRMIELLDTLQRDLDEVRQFVTAYGDAVTMPGRRPDVDADGTGRQATHGPSRPTEATALDERRAALHEELKIGARLLPYAIATVRGVSASMDRMLSLWEGEYPDQSSPGGD
ncbi:hypothetical protein [Streptomyces sp. NPDC005302]|uniref:DUF7169 domain-containing protein n=1 Tax=Streptomyces sp. NPDC005302 TaxID=3154675 RepID=UPI0033B99F4A